MNSNKVCIFPDTIPRSEVLFPLVQVFEPVVYLRPVENDEPDASDLSPLCSEMIGLGLISFDCPAPLADNRDRFLSLVHDLQHRRDDYAGQLSHLSLAGLGSTKTESKSSIIESLLRQSGIEDKQEEQQAMLLWQARLLLKLAENFDREQQELQNNLDRISAMEKGLLEKLREEDEQPFSLTRAIAGRGDREVGQLRLRLKAWSRLFGLGSQMVSPTVLITTSRDGLDLLTGQYEKEHEFTPLPMLNLLLPGGRRSDNFAEQRAAFRNEASPLLQTLKRGLEDTTSINQQEWSGLNGPESEWANLLERYYPSAEYSRTTLTLYSLPGTDPENFFIKTFGRENDETLAGTSEDRTRGIIIGFLEEQPT